MKMSAEDIFRFVEDRLQVEEDIREAERTCQIRSSGRDTPARERDQWDRRPRSRSRDTPRWGKVPPKQIHAISSTDDKPRPVSPPPPPDLNHLQGGVPVPQRPDLRHHRGVGAQALPRGRPPLKCGSPISRTLEEEVPLLQPVPDPVQPVPNPARPEPSPAPPSHSRGGIQVLCRLP